MSKKIPYVVVAVCAALSAAALVNAITKNEVAALHSGELAFILLLAADLRDGR